MAKPSIFSKDYQKRMKRRKIIIGSTIIFIIVVGGLLIVKKSLTPNIKEKISSETNKETPTQKEDTLPTPQEENQTKESTVMEKSIDGPIVSGNMLKIQYEDKNGEKAILSVLGEGSYTYDISPNKKSVIITDSTTQDMKLIDINNGEKNITKTSYKTKSGKVFTKEDILKSYPTQIWNEQGKFIDDNTIAYVSNLPYFGSGDLYKYIWILDLKNGDHRALFNTKAKRLSIKEVDNGVIKLDVDGEEKNLNAEGNLY